MLPDTLEEWLAYLERLHPSAIDLGLTRVREVADRLNRTPNFPLIVVGGTNGKGSTCAMLEAILLAAGYRVGLYTSPHLLRYNERVRIDGRMVDDAALCAAFAAVEAARGEVSLTYFEFGTLATMWLFQQADLDVAVLEVGLGGRLDAVNVFEPDVAVITTVDLDHQAFLGDTRERIGFEKAGIFRPGKAAICADAAPPQSMSEHAAAIGARYLRIGREFGFERGVESWLFRGPDAVRAGLPYPALRGPHQLANASATLAALDELRQHLPVAQAHIRTGLLSARPPGRFQTFPGRPQLVLDVAHNPEAARALAENLRAQWVGGRTHGVFGVLRDKDIRGIITPLRDVIDQWWVGGLSGPRAATADEVCALLETLGLNGRAFPDIARAYAAACQEAGENDRICAFGSFYTVADVLHARGAKD